MKHPLCMLAAAAALAGSLGCKPSPSSGERANTASAGISASETAASAGKFYDDGLITTQVKAALLGDDSVKALDIGVTTAQGVVQLSGSVQTPEQKAAAERDAKKVPGVKRVDNAVTVP